MRASIILVTYNSRGDIDACLRSLRQHAAGAEVIVVDNLSTDGTLDHVRRCYPDATAVAAGRNGGYGAGANLGAQLAHGEHLVILNPDTEVEAGWLDALLRTLEERHEVGLVTPTILLQGEGERVNACGNDVHLTGLAFCAGLNEDAPPTSAPPCAVAAVSGAAFAVRRDVWERLGGFDERFFMYLEDTDLSLRARRLGYDILHVPASRIRHRYSVRVSATKLYHLERNRLLMLRKNLSPRALILLSPALLLTETLTWAFCLRQGRAYTRAKWRSYGSLWRERREPVTASLHVSSLNVRDTPATAVARGGLTLKGHGRPRTLKGLCRRRVRRAFKRRPTAGAMTITCPLLWTTVAWQRTATAVARRHVGAQHPAPTLWKHVASRQADRAVLDSLGPRLALEQLESNAIATAANRALTTFYRCSRLAALAVVGR